MDGDDLLAGLKAIFLSNARMSDIDVEGAREADRARRDKMRECRRRARRFLAEEGTIYLTMPEDEQLERFPTLRQRENCVKVCGPPFPVCTFPDCGAPETLGVPLDAETRASFKLPKMEHDPE